MLTAINSGDTTWVLVCSVLVFFLSPGLILVFEESWKPVCVAIALLILQWVLIGYSLALGPDHNGWIGTLALAGLRGVGAEPNLEYAGTIPHTLFMLYRGMGAAVAPLLFLLPFAHRLRMRAVVCLSLLWTTLVYDPVAHWVLSIGGFLRVAGIVDVAGASTLYISTAAAAAALATVLRHAPDPDARPTDASGLPYAGIGAILIWLGGIGINVGSTFAANAAAANAMVMTCVAAAGGALVWSTLDALMHQELSPAGMLAGAVSGLVSVSPSAGSAGLGSALAAGIGGALVAYRVLVFLQKKFGRQPFCHSIGLFGASACWGLLLAGVFNGGQILIQLKATVAVGLYSFAMSWILIKVTEILIGLNRLDPGPAGA